MNYTAKILMNSLYGRFGMEDSLPETVVLDKDLLTDFLDKNTNIIEMIELGNKYLIQYNSDDNIELENNHESHNINIAIASAITSYSRIHMSQFKNNSNYKLFYSDTDSIYINKVLSKNLVNHKLLGSLKLEVIADKAIFLAPKVYSLLTNDQIISKVKGLSKEGVKKITFNDFENLLYKNSNLEIQQVKWYKSLENSTINVKNQIYTLKVTSNKRELIYNSENKLINTKPYKMNNDTIK